MDNFGNYMFTANATGFVCPNWALFAHLNWQCPPPQACASEPITGKQYCCPSSCWTTSSACATDGSTFECTNSGYSWCCLKNKESCTQLPGQINICISLTADVLGNISTTQLNETYLNLSSAQPSASSYAFDPLKLISQTQTSLTSTSSTSTLISTTSIPSNSSNGQPSPHHLSSGAIAGIVIGVLTTIVLAFLALCLLVRRRKKGHNRSAPERIAKVDLVQAHEHQRNSGYIPQELQAYLMQPKELPAT